MKQEVKATLYWQTTTKGRLLPFFAIKDQFLPKPDQNIRKIGFSYSNFHRSWPNAVEGHLRPFCAINDHFLNVIFEGNYQPVTFNGWRTTPSGMHYSTFFKHFSEKLSVYTRLICINLKTYLQQRFFLAREWHPVASNMEPKAFSTFLSQI